MFKKSESGRTMLEMLCVLGGVLFLGAMAVVAFFNASSSHEADRVYEDIVLTVSSVRNKGTARTNSGMADTRLVMSRTRTGKRFSVETGCPDSAFTIKVGDIDQKTCSYLMNKGWHKILEPLYFYRAKRFEDVCRSRVLDNASDGYYMLVGVDCSKTNAPESGVFAVTFALSSGAQKVQYCRTNDACPVCQKCHTGKQICVPISGCSVG